jgi:putative redox protein
LVFSDFKRGNRRNKMAVEIVSTYVGELSVRNVHGPSQSTFDTTAPVDNGGTGKYFSPTDLLATSFGSCALTVMGKAIEQEGVDFRDATVSVTKHMQKEPRRLSKLLAVFTLPAGCTPSQRGLLERTAKECPARLSLHPEVEVEFLFNYDL